MRVAGYKRRQSFANLLFSTRNSALTFANFYAAHAHVADCFAIRLGAPSLTGLPPSQKRSTGSFLKFPLAVRLTLRNFALCGERPEALPLDFASFLKKAGPKTLVWVTVTSLQ